MKVFNLIILFIIAILSSYSTYSQTGNIDIIADSKIQTIVEQHKSLNDKEKQVGWRVQIFFDSGTNSKAKAYGKKSLFDSKYYGIKSYLTFQTPNYKIRVGDFRTRWDADGFKQQILNDFSDSFVVKDEINFPVFW